MIDIVFPSAARDFDGIGDHSRILASELSQRGHRVRLIGAGEPGISVPGVEYVDAWPDGNLRSTDILLELCEPSTTAAVVLQWEQFSYGYRGYNPEISRFFGELRTRNPQSARILMAHEAYTEPTSLRKSVMWVYQKRQAIRLTQSASAVFHSSGRGTRLLGRYDRNARVLPVFPNIPVSLSGSLTRESLNIPPHALVILVFGYIDAARRAFIEEGLRACVRGCDDVFLLYVGKDASLASRIAQETGVPSAIVERASSVEVSSAMQISDVALSPFPDGVSLRRGSFAALLLHGVPTVTNVGRDTEQSLLTLAGAGAFALSSPGISAYGSVTQSLVRSETLRSHARSVLRALRPGENNLELSVRAIELHTLR